MILPDSTELELADGASGLDAARAIGPKLAEQAVLVKADGVPQDLRLPLPDGARLQILTTRDTQDPDALAVLRHSAAHLLAEAVRRLHPDVKVAIGPPIDNGFYYDFDFPSPIHEADLEAIEAEVQRELAEGRAWEREEISADEARARFTAEDEPYKVELVDTAEGAISLYTQGDFTDLCRGPHLQTSAPIKAFKLTSLAGAYWRGDSSNAQLTRIYGTAFFSQKDLDAHLERLEEARARDHRRLGAELDLFHFDEHSPGSPFWHPKGMAIFNALEDLRRRENARRGYSEVKTPLIYDKALWVTSGHWEKFRENMFLIPIDDEHTYAIKPMNCPGHMLLFGSQLRSYRELPLRFAEAAPLHRNELAGALHGLTRVRYVTQDDAHIFCSREQIDSELDACLEYLRYLYGLFGIEPRAELSTRPENKLGADEEWDFTGGQADRGARPPRDRVLRRRGGGLVLRAEDRPPHHRRARPLVAARHDPARRPDAGPLRAHLHGRRQPRASGVRRPPSVLRLARALHRDHHRALRRRVPALARAGPGARARRQRAASRWRARDRRRGSARPAIASTSTTATRRSASGSATASSRRSRSSSSSASASPRQRSPCGRAGRVSRRGRSTSCSTTSRRPSRRRSSWRRGARSSCDAAVDTGRNRARRSEAARPRRSRAGGRRARRATLASPHTGLPPCYAFHLQSRGRYPHLRSHELRGFNRVERRGKRCRCLPAAFDVSGKELHGFEERHSLMRSL